MVFHDIESITEVISGHRIIMYYIVCNECNTASDKCNLPNSVDSVLEMLVKKNDELIIFKFSQNNKRFNDFKELYKPHISGPIALFAINAEGIPLICEEIYHEDDVYQACSSICMLCKLNPLSNDEVTKVINNASGKSLSGNFDKGTEILNDTEPCVQSTSTVLQIRLPDGTKEKQKFDKQAFLQEVFEFIRAKFNINDFDLKTFNRSVFTKADYEKTLQDLDLIPNGVVIVVYKNLVPFKNNSIISRVFQYGFLVFYGKITSTFTFVKGLFYTFWYSFFSSGTGNSRGIENQAQESYSGKKKGTNNGAKRSVSRFGNVHTLRRNDDSDDENNRYNGNSTQQK